MTATALTAQAQAPGPAPAAQEHAPDASAQGRAVQEQAPAASERDPGQLQSWRIIDRQMIDSYNLRSISEAVELVAGFAYVRTYLKRNIPTARGVLQSHYANRVLVMIDGVDAWHASTGEGSLDRVSIEEVERVEVLTGPASVVFGSQAYAGVVNIVLRRARRSGEARRAGETARLATAHAGFGTPTRYDAGMSYSQAGERSSWLVSGNLADTAGSKYVFADESGARGNIEELARSANMTVSGTFQDASASTHRFRVNAFRFDATNLGVTPNLSRGMGHEHENSGFLISYAWSRTMSERIDLEARVAYDGSRREFSRSRDDNTRSEVEGYRIIGTAAADVRLSERSLLRVGFDFDHRNSSKYTNFDVLADVELEQNNMRDRSVWEASLVANYGYASELLNVGGGVRVIDNQNFGAHAIFAGSLGYHLRNSHSVWLRAGQSYRSPTLFELFFETSSRTVFGSADLEPEASNTFELEYDGMLKGVDLRAVAFHTAYDRQIVRVRRNPGSAVDTSLIYVNGPGFSSSGLEVEARYRSRPPARAAQWLSGLAGTELFVIYAFLRGSGENEGAASDAPFRFVPDHTLALGLANELGPFIVSGLVEYRSSTDGPVATIPGQERIDLNLGYRHRYGEAELLHFVSVDNITNSELAIAEYVRQNLNLIYDGFGRSISYFLKVRF